MHFRARHPSVLECAVIGVPDERWAGTILNREIREQYWREEGRRVH